MSGVWRRAATLRGVGDGERVNAISHGVDIVPVERIARMLNEHGPRFLDRCFTPGEQVICRGHARAAERLAARFAAKEAVLKALGTGWSGGIAWTDVEVITLPTGAPSLALHNRAAKIADDRGIRSWLISLSHAGGMAMASAIALDTPSPPDAGAVDTGGR